MVRTFFSLLTLMVFSLGMQTQLIASDMDNSDEDMGSFVNEACPMPVTEQEMILEEEMIPATPETGMASKTKPMNIKIQEELAPEEETVIQQTEMPMPSAQTPGAEGMEEEAEDLSLAL